MLCGRIIEHRTVIKASQRLMDVTRVAGMVVVPLRHERYRAALLPGNFLAGIFDNDMAIRHVQSLCITHVNLFLTGTGFPLAVFNRHASPLQTRSYGPHHFFLLCGLENVIVLVVVAGSRQTSVAALVRGLKTVIKQIKLKLGGHHRLKALVL